uniref:Uncharacterized protein n=1 Tax=Sphaerodactylus townsendi TaxID=933632 RepID=A0ACB8FVE7_9SAUR
MAAWSRKYFDGLLAATSADSRVWGATCEPSSGGHGGLGPSSNLRLAPRHAFGHCNASLHREIRQPKTHLNLGNFSQLGAAAAEDLFPVDGRHLALPKELDFTDWDDFNAFRADHCGNNAYRGIFVEHLDGRRHTAETLLPYRKRYGGLLCPVEAQDKLSYKIHTFGALHEEGGKAADGAAAASSFLSTYSVPGASTWRAWSTTLTFARAGGQNIDTRRRGAEEQRTDERQHSVAYGVGSFRTNPCGALLASRIRSKM